MSSSIGTRRHLPPWMLRKAATDQSSNSGSEVVNKEDGLEELSTEACQPKSSVEVRQHSSDVATGHSESTKTDSHSLKKGKTTRSRRKLVKQAEDDGCNLHEGNLEKESYAPPPPRKRKAKAPKATRSNATDEPTLSEDEFSVDDLISIAKEYVNSEKTREGQRPSLAERESASLDRSISSEDKTSHRDNIRCSDSISNASTLEGSSSDLGECQPSERGVNKVSSSGDFAQDMLELFLGSRVKRSSEIKSSPKPVANRVAPNYASSSETKDGSVGDAVQLAKKKGSFKDQVEMLIS